MDGAPSARARRWLRRGDDPHFASRLRAGVALQAEAYPDESTAERWADIHDEDDKPHEPEPSP